MIIAALVAILAQDPEALVERLRSGSPVERDEAVAALKALGEKAEAALKKAAEDSDVDVAAAAERLLDRLSIERSVTPRMKRAFPGVVERLATSELAWAETLTSALRMTGLPGGMKNADLAPLADRALRAPAPSGMTDELAGELAERGIREAVPGLVARSFDPDEDVSRSALSGLVRLSADEAVPELRRRLGARDERVRRLALVALGSLDAEDAVESVLPLLKDGSPGVRSEALAVLEMLRYRSPEAKPVAALLKDPVEEVRAAAAKGLLSAQARGTLAELRAALDDPSARVRSRSVVALARLGGVDAVPDLLAMLGDREGYVREQAVGELGRLRPASAFAPLLRAAESDDDASVRRSATWALRRYPGATEALGRIALKGTVAVRRSALLALKGKPTSSILPALVQSLRDPQSDLRAAAEALLAQDRTPAGEAAVRPLLDDPDPNVRWSAVGVLSAWKDVGMIDSIRRGLEDPSDRIRKTAIACAGALGDPALSDALTRRIADPETSVSDSAKMAMSKVPASIPVLLELLSHEREAVRRNAISTLWALRAAESFAPVRRMLKDASPTVVQEAVLMLAAYRQEDALPEIRPLLKAADAELRASTARALAEMGDRASAGDIAALASDPDSRVRKESLDALVLLSHPLDADTLAARLRDESDRVRVSACLAAGSWRIPSTERALSELLEDADLHVREAAIEGLVRMEARSSLPAIAERLRDPSVSVAAAAAGGLARLKASTYAIEVARRLSPARSDAETAWMLGELGPLDLDALRRLLAGPSWRERAAAAKALGAHGDPEVLPALSAAIRDPSATVRRVAAEAVGLLGQASALEALQPALGDPEELVRYRAVEAVGTIGTPAGVRLLREALRDTDSDVRALALRRLARLDPAGSVDDFVRGLSDPVESVGRAAALSLGQEGSAEAVAALRAWVPDEEWTSTETARATALCWAGVDDGVDLLVRGARPNVLNRLLAPEAWRKMATTPWKGPRTGRIDEILKEAAGQAGLRLEFAERTREDYPVLIRPGSTLLEVIERAYPNRHWVIDGGTFRCLTWFGARDFWQAWAKTRKKQ